MWSASEESKRRAVTGSHKSQVWRRSSLSNQESENSKSIKLKSFIPYRISSRTEFNKLAESVRSTSYSCKWIGLLELIHKKNRSLLRESSEISSEIESPARSISVNSALSNDLNDERFLNFV